MRAAVVGVTGYSGTELFRILSNHPKIEEINLYAREKEGVSKRFLNKEVSAFRNIENELLPYDAKKSWTKRRGVLCSSGRGYEQACSSFYPK